MPRDGWILMVERISTLSVQALLYFNLMSGCVVPRTYINFLRSNIVGVINHLFSNWINTIFSTCFSVMVFNLLFYREIRNVFSDNSPSCSGFIHYCQIFYCCSRPWFFFFRLIISLLRILLEPQFPWRILPIPSDSTRIFSFLARPFRIHTYKFAIHLRQISPFNYSQSSPRLRILPSYIFIE